MELRDYLQKASEMGASDIFVLPAAPVSCKVKGEVIPVGGDILKPEDTKRLITEAYALAHRDMSQLDEDGDDDFSFPIPGISRFRCNAYYQRGTIAATLRMISFSLPRPEELNIPKSIVELGRIKSGLILVTGPAGSGKSTTLACIIDWINSNRKGHIVTVEDPIEYLHKHKQSLISQREVPNDARSFPRALRAALRQAPEVIMLGEMRDLDTIQTSITAAETGHLVLSSLHTTGAAKTVDRIMDIFPAEQQAQIRMQLSVVLRAVVSQRLVQKKEGGQTVVFELMTVNTAIQNLIRDGRTHQIENAIFSGASQGMMSMDMELLKLYRSGAITRENALLYAVSPETLEKRLI
ncbi:MAG: PilT/PilU family type 4a pilus ATPase [Blautia sp.]|nr:PilT/PilU family type 4a pilus ATPase [Blautia sp.]